MKLLQYYSYIKAKKPQNKQSIPPPPQKTNKQPKPKSKTNKTQTKPLELGKFSKCFPQKTSASLVFLKAQQYFRHRIIGLVFLKVQGFQRQSTDAFWRHYKSIPFTLTDKESLLYCAGQNLALDRCSFS